MDVFRQREEDEVEEEEEELGEDGEDGGKVQARPKRTSRYPYVPPRYLEHARAVCRADSPHELARTPPDDDEDVGTYSAGTPFLTLPAPFLPEGGGTKSTEALSLGDRPIFRSTLPGPPDPDMDPDVAIYFPRPQTPPPPLHNEDQVQFNQMVLGLKYSPMSPPEGRKEVLQQRLAVVKERRMEKLRCQRRRHNVREKAYLPPCTLRTFDTSFPLAEEIVRHAGKIQALSARSRRGGPLAGTAPGRVGGTCFTKIGHPSGKKMPFHITKMRGGGGPLSPG